jgi:hypothetical protein
MEFTGRQPNDGDTSLHINSPNQPNLTPIAASLSHSHRTDVLLPTSFPVPPSTTPAHAIASTTTPLVDILAWSLFYLA